MAVTGNPSTEDRLISSQTRLRPLWLRTVQPSPSCQMMIKSVLGLGLRQRRRENGVT